jgi:hypothetical protein
MNKKRGVVILLLCLLLVSSLATARLTDDEDYEETVFGIPSDPFLFTHVVGIGNTDGDKNGCQAGLSPFGIVSHKKSENGLNIYYPSHKFNTGWDCSWSGCSKRTGPAACEWKNMPLDQNGCYFMSSERDGTTDDECYGWFVKPGENYVISGKSIVAKEDLFENDKEAEGQGFFAKLENYIVNHKVTGNFDITYSDGEDAICLFNEYNFKSLDRAFTCVEQEDEFRWNICDKDHLSENTNQFIPLKEKDEEDVDVDGKPLEFGYEVTSEDDATHGWFCEEDNNGYIWELKPVSCTDGSINCDTNEDVCVQNGFDFIPDGGCCGNDEFEDLGKKGNKDGTNYICLKDEAEKVGGELPNLVRVAESENSESVGWYWVPATQTQHHILTIKKPNKEPYDVVSNNERWVECRSEDVNYQGDKGVSEGLVESDELKEANRFYCYHEGDRWSWAES